VKRSDRARRREPAGRAERPASEAGRRAGRQRAGAAIVRDLAILVAAFGAAVGIAEVAGAANLGVAFGVGQVVFVLALLALLSRG
jgi:hypothetical protein